MSARERSLCGNLLANTGQEKLMVALRDGRKLVGVLRSWDQFGMDTLDVVLVRRVLIGAAGNLVLQDTIERLFVQNLYADIERGLFLVRGENVSLLGEIVRSSIRTINGMLLAWQC